MKKDIGLTPFKIIKGGRTETAEESTKEFISAYATDTRLMGVTGLYIHWFLPDNQTNTHLHQFFSLDAEEFGLDTYESFLGNGSEDDNYQIRKIEAKIIGGLGGEKIILTEREARRLVQKYVDFNLRTKQTLPGNLNEYQFLLANRIELSETEKYVLMCKQCSLITSENQVINYFLMRCFGYDFSGAKFLTKNYVRTNLFPELGCSAMLMNTIDEANDITSGINTDYYCTDDDKNFGTFNTRKSYICQSVIDTEEKYYLAVTQITLDHLKVVGFEKISCFQITLTEVAMMTARPEYVSVIDFFGDDSEINEDSTPLLSTSIMTQYDEGRLFMIFFPHNKHVGRNPFHLNDDVFGIYYVMESGQILLSAYSRENLLTLEKDCLTSLGDFVQPVAKYRFDSPVLFDFIKNGFDDFIDFAETISEEGDDYNPEDN